MYLCNVRKSMRSIPLAIRFSSFSLPRIKCKLLYVQPCASFCFNFELRFFLFCLFVCLKHVLLLPFT